MPPVLSMYEETVERQLLVNRKKPPAGPAHEQQPSASAGWRSEITPKRQQQTQRDESSHICL